MMLLIILSVLGLAASRVTALQERMAGTYLMDMRAFQNAEDQLRDSERLLLGANPDVVCTSPPKKLVIPGPGCLPGATTLECLATGTFATVIENLNHPRLANDEGINLGGSRQGSEVTQGGINCLLFRISSHGPDNPTVQGSDATVQSYFVP
ncbi:hypothetical protein IFO71_20035 [Pseudoxanthomonas sp. CAU 1598]|uniref:Type IV pilus assembly protein PilX n=2 Tax=Pseudomarimonas arenosa TaxID=2774145 RepID=A0AAW3ZPF4_9GAMM|nr:hypothetical protein [Pseudomarimonas arenosa]